MGMNIGDYAKHIKNTEGKFKDPSKKSPTTPKPKFCSKCGLQIKSAIVSSLLFDGEFCKDCVREMG